ncbi:putative glucanase [Aspergillus insuetus]
MATGFLRVTGNQIADENGTVVLLRGASLGGVLNMENFVNGYPGSESFARAAMLKAMGAEHYEYFFKRFFHHFFTDKDVEYLKSLGINSLRIPFGYKHFEDDMNPRDLKNGAFTYLDHIVSLCANHGIYSILDMHTVPGCQNPDWHSDNHTSYAAFWDHKDHQDRTVWLWERVAEHYKDNPWVAGYNPLNEPCDSEQVRVAAFYERVERAIRIIDPNHILFLDGNTFAMEWKGFDKALPNAVYSIHDYSMMGFPGQRYKGTEQQNQKLRQQYLRKCEFHHKHGVPIWVGEFGPTYEMRDQDAEQINNERFGMLAEQLNLYETDKVSWSLWTYKDIGTMGMVSVSPESAYLKLLRPFLERKATLGVDSSNYHPSERLVNLVDQMAAWIDEVSPTATKTYPPNWDTKQHVRRNILQTFLASSLCDEFAAYFRGLDKVQLEELAQSWAFENCIKREGLNATLTQIKEKYGA